MSFQMLRSVEAFSHLLRIFYTMITVIKVFYNKLWRCQRRVLASQCRSYHLIMLPLRSTISRSWDVWYVKKLVLYFFSKLEMWSGVDFKNTFFGILNTTFWHFLNANFDSANTTSWQCKCQKFYYQIGYWTLALSAYEIDFWLER